MQSTPTIRDLSRPILPGTYVELWLQLLEKSGVPRQTVLEGTGIVPGDLTDAGRLSPVAVALAIARGMGLTKDPTLAFEFGLTMKPTAHGVLGYALMTCATLRDAILLAQRYLHVRVARANVRLRVDQEVAAIVLGDSLLRNPLRPFLLEVFTGAILRTGEMLLGAPLPPVELWLDYPEPAHFSALKARLPAVRFRMPSVELRFAQVHLERALPLADAMANREAVATLERELSHFCANETPEATATRLRGLLQDTNGSELDLAQAARRLHTSERSLKRHLEAEGTSYRRILAEVRLEKARALLRVPDLTVEHIAERLGYTDGANFTRAFRKWSGESPRAYRDRSSAR
jgi:AraC-like DNA-binding protein